MFTDADWTGAMGPSLLLSRQRTSKETMAKLRLNFCTRLSVIITGGDVSSANPRYSHELSARGILSNSLRLGRSSPSCFSQLGSLYHSSTMLLNWQAAI